MATSSASTNTAGAPNQDKRGAARSNDQLTLTPKTPSGGRALKFDFPSLNIGVAEYAEGPTGCTVFYFPKGAQGAVDIRGGSPGTFMAGDGFLDALCYAGGSLYGLEAANGVAAELFALRGYSAEWTNIALVRGAIIFDYRPRTNAIYPDKALGRAALRAAASGTFPLGGHGAGCSATVGKCFGPEQREFAGQGGAFRRIGATKLAVFTVVNAVGAIVDRDGNVVRGHRDPKTGERRSIARAVEETASAIKPTPGNTTLTAVVTNQKLDGLTLRQLGRQVHSSMTRCIQPFHSLDDGDVLYAITTNEVENAELNATALGVLASELAWDAVLTCFQGRE